MDARTPRLCRSRPRLDYVWLFDSNRRRLVPARKEAIRQNGITFVRCGGGYRVVRRLRLPGD
jgi:hypothetical protein